MTTPRLFRLLDLAALLLAFNLSVAPVAEASPEPGPPAPVVVVAMNTAFTPGQGDVAAKARKAAPVVEQSDVVAKGEAMSEARKYTQAEWAARMAAEERREQARDALMAGYVIMRPYLSAVIRNPRQPHFPRVYRWEQN